MSTTIVTTWATDIAQLGPVYPFVGTEFLLWILGLVFWLGFHFLQSRAETRSLSEQEEVIGEYKETAERLIKAETRN